MNFLKKYKIIPLNEAELLQHYFKTGDMEYLAKLYNKYVAMIYGVCLHILQDVEEARDATMEIYEIMVNNLDNSVTNIGSWIYTVTRNHALMILRKKRRQQIRELFYSQQHHTDEENLDEELHIKLKDFITKLPYEQSICIRLFYLEEKNYQEITENTGYSYKQVKSYIQNGKRNLRIILTKLYDKE